MAENKRKLADSRIVWDEPAALLASCCNGQGPILLVRAKSAALVSRENAARATPLGSAATSIAAPASAQWETAVGAAISAAAVHGDLVLVATAEKQLVRLAADDGRQLASVATPRKVRLPPPALPLPLALVLTTLSLLL